MAEKKVACPWCGAEMEAQIPGVHKRLEEPFDIYCSTFYVCQGCGAAGPHTEVIVGDDDGLADKIRECMEKAYTTALRRPMQKPLTHDQALAMLNDGIPVWIEERYKQGGWNVPSGLNCVCASPDDENQCGITWRPWATKPTVVEREAAAWKS